ncbi:S8 family serine peptidase [Pontibacter ruber]|uniref:S8 family serine peptidase n=1 Tax=Pontibacter ruber TaxID=1343895 RepID=A0ABW5CT90_9BACT|nr:S8 family serine peptidase [Pontibacter ruber]
MITALLVLKRFFRAFLVSFLFVPFLYGQAQPKPAAGVGVRTKPHTVVYKLKSQPAGELRLAQGSTAGLQAVLQQVGAKQVLQKFPKAAPPVNARKGGGVDLSLIYEMTYSEGQTLEEIRRKLMSTGMVEYVEPLYQREPLYQPNDPASDSTRTTQSYLKLIGAYSGWAVEKGDSNIVIGILDTGFRLSHSDLKTQVKHNYDDPVDGIDNDGDGYTDNFSGWDFAEKDNNTFDDSYYVGHGTGVAGAAAAASDNGNGMSSLGFRTKFLPLKIFPSTANGSFRGYEAIVYAADKGCSIINLSWGGEGYSQYEQDIINYAVLNRDVVIVASGGNTNANLNIYPASYDNVLSVGGTDGKDVKFRDYTYSYKIDLTAPSINIYTTSFSGDNAYGGFNGTSAASPIVAGAAALVRSRFPHLNAQQVIERLRVTSDDIYNLPGNQPYLEMLGRGRLNVKRALMETTVKSVRNTLIRVAGNRIAQLNDTLALEGSFTNFLSPATNLQVKLSTTSPYVKILDDELTLGSMATMATADNRSRPFRFVVLPNAPHNMVINFRLGFTDGTYSDYQYFQIPVNPDHITLSASDLQMTVNGKGNIGYNAFNFNQGVGITYKGSNSLLFEGGLLLASDAQRVSDNVRNAYWQTDEDFATSSPIRMHYNTRQADQEIRSIMHDTYPSEQQVGVQVSQRSFAWSGDKNKDFVVLEYTVKNITPDTIKTLHAGLFADWNIGNPYINAADWDSANKMGYVYNVGEAMPYAGIKLLTSESPSYYAIDNLSGGRNTFSIADGFSAEEKYKALSGGVARQKAGMNGSGNDVSHVVGVAATKLAPNETRTIAFAIVAGDNLTELKKHAVAAQERYQFIRSGPAPLAVNDTLCAGTPVMVAPKGGKLFKFYADNAKNALLGIGPNYSIPELTQNTTLYVSNADSVFESALVPVAYTIATPEARFTIDQEKPVINRAITFQTQGKNIREWLWSFGNGETTTEPKPVYTYTEPGTYNVQLVIKDKYGCTNTTSQTIEVLQAAPTAVNEPNEGSFQVYPNPTTGLLTVSLPEDGKAPVMILTDMMGKTIQPVLRQHHQTEAIYDLSALPEGVYTARITFDKASITRKIVLLRK